MKVTIFIDESGTLPDPKDPVVIVAAIGTEAPQKIAKITQKIRKRQTLKNVSEIKFYRAGEKTKIKFLKLLIENKPEIFVLITEKEGKSIPDTPENFAVLCWQLIEECLPYYNQKLLEVVFDRHFYRKIDQSRFDQILCQLTPRALIINHLDSQKNPAINSADMVAGSVLWEKTGKDGQFYRLIKPKITVEKTVKWKAIKGRFWQEKTHLNRRKRPSKVSV